MLLDGLRGLELLQRHAILLMKQTIAQLITSQATVQLQFVSILFVHATHRIPQDALYGPRKRSPSKWIRCDGASATQTSVSHAMSPTRRLMVD